MPPIPSIPTEIWQLILRYVISVPVFLDPDGVASTGVKGMSKYHIYHSESPWNDEKPYWAAERYRNACRRVCKSWNTYLQSFFEHRFVKMRDIRHGLVPASALQKATRVAVSIHYAGCEVCLTTRNQTRGVSIRKKWDSAVQFFVATMTSVGQIRAEIVTYEAEPVSFETVSFLARYFSDIVTFTSDNFTPDGAVRKAIQLFPRLRHLTLGNYQQSTEGLKLDAPSLQTLSCQPSILYRALYFSSLKWNVPALHTLHITSSATHFTEFLSASVIVPLLRMTGPQLRHLYVAEQYLPHLPLDLWDICEKLECITAATVGPPLSTLPVFHPLHTIVIPSCSAGILKLKIPRTSAIRKVVMDFPWAMASNRAPINHWAEKWNPYFIRLEDIHGVSVHEWLENGDRGVASDTVANAQ